MTHIPKIDKTRRIDFYRKSSLEGIRGFVEHNAQGLLALAAKYNSTRMAKDAIERGAEVAYFHADGMAPIHIAAKWGSVEVLEYLLKRGVDPNLLEMSDGRTPLHVAVGDNHSRAVEVILQYGGLVDACDKNGNTPLHVAVYCKNMRCAESLVAAGASPHLSNTDGATASDIANVDPCMIQLLSSRNRNHLSRDNKGNGRGRQ